MESFRDKVLSEDAAELLRKGGVTIMGRDKKGQSNIVLNLDRTPKINKKNVEALIEAQEFVLLVSRKYSIIGKYSERFNLIFDFAKQKVPVSPTFVKKFLFLFEANFGTFLDKTILFRPSGGFAFLWKIILGQNVISERDLLTIEFIEAKNIEKLREIICEDDMEKLYGGNLPDEGHYKGKYWPPRPSKQGEAITDEDIKARNLQFFNNINKEEDYKFIYPKYKPTFE